MEKLEEYLLQTGQVDETDSRLLRQIAYERLQDAMRHANLQPGEPLSETRISKALGISRTPVREALQQLAQEGLVQIIPGRAVTVAAPSMQELLDAVHVRQLLEPELVRLVTEMLPANAADTLQAIIGDMEQAARIDDRAAWSKADSLFHETLSHYCPNRLLGQLVLQARNRVHQSTVDDQTSAARVLDYTEEHSHIARAILARDSQTAERLVREHIERLRQNMFKRLAHY